MSLIKNAASMFISLGTDDQSARAVVPSADPIPQHLVKFLIRAPRGTTKPVTMGVGKLISMYGSDAFDVNGKFYNHQTRFLTAVGSTGSTVMVQRVVSQDAGVKSNIVVYIDVLSTQIPNYVRNSLGEKVIDPDTNDYKVNSNTPTIDGYKIKFITEYQDSGSVNADIRTYASKPGTMTDGRTTSTMYPIMAGIAKYQGSDYNNIGFSIESLLYDDVDSDIVDETKSLPYKLALYSRTKAGSVPVVARSLYGEPSVQFSFKEKAINPKTGSRFDFEAIFGTQWYNETDELKTLKYEEYEDIHIYRKNLELVQGLIMSNEKTHINDDATVVWDDGLTSSTRQWFDFTTADQDGIDEEGYLLNLFTCKSSKNIPYFTVMVSDDVATLTGKQKEVNITKNTPIFLNGGSDGTLTNEYYESAVSIIMADYADSDSKVIDNAINVETVIYDSGFTVPAKEALMSFISVRNDTNLVLSTHVDELGEKDLPLSEARAVAVALRTKLRLKPESEYFGTPVMRAVIVLGTGLMRDGSTYNRIPLTYELAIKSARFMGAGDGKWKTVYAFDHGERAILEELVDVSPSFIPTGIKPTLWNDGIVTAQPKDRVQYFFPAIQTVYDDDTSVLNSWPNAFACGVLDRIGSDAWREFTGSSFLSDSEFIYAVEAYCNERVSGIFGGLLTVIPEVIIDSADEQRGYSFHLNIKLYANNMKTVMVYSTSAYRSSDLQS